MISIFMCVLPPGRLSGGMNNLVICSNFIHREINLAVCGVADHFIPYHKTCTVYFTEQGLLLLE